MSPLLIREEDAARSVPKSGRAAVIKPDFATIATPHPGIVHSQYPCNACWVAELQLGTDEQPHLCFRAICR